MENVSIKNLLHWANQFDYFCFLNSNSFENYPYNGFENYIAVGNIPPTTSLEILKKEIPENWLFGHFSYDLKNQIENLTSKNEDKINLTDVSFFKPEIVIELSNQELDIIYSTTENPTLLESIKQFKTPTIVENQVSKIHSKISKESYFEKFEKVRKQIENGNVYELNLCQEFYSENSEINPISTYLNLCEISPMPFSTLYKINDKYLISASPERFLKKEGNKLISQPIKGTNKAFENKIENNIQQEKLRNSEKERSENIMIVDLVRNDLSKSSVPGTVKVEELLGVYKMNHVNQMISTIISEKIAEIDNLEVILNAFPMGSMTGAPKIEAMKIIEELEESKRGLYSGSVGYLAPNGNFDFNVVIRSIIYDSKNKKISFQVGGAITYDANAEDEYNECLLKAEVIRKLLENEIQN